MIDEKSTHDVQILAELLRAEVRYEIAKSNLGNLKFITIMFFLMLGMCIIIAS